MDIQQIQKNIKKGDIAPLYVFYGTQTYLIEKCVQALSEQLLEDGAVDFNLETFNLEHSPVEDAIQAAETLPFMGDKRLVVARGADFLTGKNQQTKIEHQLNALEHYINNPVEYSVVVLIVHAEKLDERKKLVKSLKQKAIVASALSLDAQQMVPWMKQQVKAHGVTIEDDACGLLQQFVGDNLQMLSNECLKMAEYVDKGGTITVDVVNELISRTVEQDVFMLVDHIVHVRIEKAFISLRELLKRNEEPIKILFLITRQFRIILRVKDLAHQGYSQRQMSQIVGVHPYVCQLAVQQGRSFSEMQLLHIMDQLADMDYKMKTGQIDKPLALEMFLLKLGTGGQ